MIGWVASLELKEGGEGGEKEGKMYDQRQLDEWWSMHYSVVYGGMYLVAGDSIY